MKAKKSRKTVTSFYEEGKSQNIMPDSVGPRIKSEMETLKLETMMFVGLAIFAILVRIIKVF